jgi:hypothetical protein
MTKSKPSTRAISKTVVVKDAVDDTIYQNYLEEATKLTQEYEKSTMSWYWQMGDLYLKFVQSQQNNEMGNRTIQHFIADLSNQPIPIDIAVSTLYTAKQIREKYQFESIGTLIERGVKVNHLKLMLPLKDAAVEAKVSRQLVRGDGTVIPVRELKEVIDEVQKDAAVAGAKKTIQDVDKAKTKGETVYQSEDDTEALKTPSKGEHRSAKAKEFSVSPLQAFKKFDKHAIATISAIGDAIIAAYEGTKVGFDSDRAQKNYKEAFEGALGTAEQLLEPLQKLIKEMSKARKDV